MSNWAFDLSGDVMNMQKVIRFSIFDVLPVGENAAVKAVALAAQLGYSSTRALRSAVEDERQGGALILSGNGGYFRASAGEQGREEILRFYRRQAKHARRELKALRPARRALREFPRQMEIAANEAG